MFKRLAIESALATLLVLSAMWIFSLIPLSLSALQPIEKAIKDIDIIDIYYSQVNGDQTEVGKSVVLVNIGDADRFEIGWLINAIGESGPGAIGVDVFFAEPKDQFQDSVLANAIANNPVILGSAFNEKSQSLEYSFDALKPIKTGFTNFVGHNRQFATIRYFKPEVEIDGKRFPAFSLALVQANQISPDAGYADSESKQGIRFIGDYQSFKHYEKDEVLQGKISTTAFEDKIVILGYAGDYFGDPNSNEDRFFTPKNAQVSGRSFPDMNGMVIHANIVEMLMSGKMIKKTSTWFNRLFALVIIYAHVLFYMFLMVKLDYWFDPLALILQVLSSLLIIFLLFWVYHHFQIRMQVLGALAGVALAVEILFVYEALAHSLFKKFGIKSLVIDE